jgi:hypothetical protein
MEIIDIQGEEFNAKIFEDVNLRAFNDLKKTKKGCIIVMGEGIMEEDEDPEIMLGFNCDMDFYKTSSEEAERMYDNIIQHYINGIKNPKETFDKHFGGTGLLAFGLFKINDEESIIVAIDAYGDVWGSGFFTDRWGPLEVNSKKYNMGVFGVNEYSVAHADIFKCKEEDPEGIFFNDETIKALFLESALKEYNEWQNKESNQPQNASPAEYMAYWSELEDIERDVEKYKEMFSMSIEEMRTAYNMPNLSEQGGDYLHWKEQYEIVKEALEIKKRG